MKFVKYSGYMAAFLAALVFLASPHAVSAAEPANIKGFTVESIIDGKKSDLAALGKGTPMFLVFSTPT